MGGYETRNGRLTRWRALVRADGLQKLTSEGRDAIVAHGIHTVVDLRFAQELESKPNPFVNDARVTFVHAPLFEYGMVGEDSALREGPHGSAWNIALMTDFADNLGVAMRAIAQAPAIGAVLFHCHAGKDRTGVVALLLGELAGLPDQMLVADYLESNAHLAPMFDEILARYADDPQQQEAIKPKLHGHEEMVSGTLAWLRAQHGDAERYLLSIGLSAADVYALRARLVNTD